jgi:hypothetical protein
MSVARELPCLRDSQDARLRDSQDQAWAALWLRRQAEPFLFRVVRDAERWPIIPGLQGSIEWYCDGYPCHSCPLPGEPALAVFTDRARLHAKLTAIPGLVRWQVGDQEFRGVFPVEALEQVAGVIRARRRRVLSPEVARKRSGLPTVRATSRPQELAEAVQAGVPSSPRVSPCLFASPSRLAANPHVRYPARETGGCRGAASDPVRSRRCAGRPSADGGGPRPRPPGTGNCGGSS